MTAGQLSADQQAYVDTVVAQTGLNPGVVISWLGAESPWGQTSVAHNYLNIGPGHAYASAQQGAAAAAHYINDMSNYAGIRSAIPAGPQAQINAIVASPWDAGHYNVGAGGDPTQSSLSKIFHQLFGGGTPSPASSSPAGSAPASSSGNSILGAPVGFISGLFGGVVSPVVDAAVKGAIDVAFLVGGLGLIGFGLARVTQNVSGKDVVDQGGDFIGKLTTAAALIPK